MSDRAWHENIERVEWTLRDPEWQPSRDYLEKLLAAYKEAADEIERLQAELDGKISQSYAAELARQVGELETENERLRESVAALMSPAKIPTDAPGASFDEIMEDEFGQEDARRLAESMQRVSAGVTNPGQQNRPGCRFPQCACNKPWERCDK